MLFRKLSKKMNSRPVIGIPRKLGKELGCEWFVALYRLPNTWPGTSDISGQKLKGSREGPLNVRIGIRWNRDHRIHRELQRYPIPCSINALRISSNPKRLMPSSLSLACNSLPIS
jgi:hypothetical protein